MAVDLAAIDGTVACVDDRENFISPSSRPAARANLLCDQEAATTHDAQARRVNFNPLKQAKAMQRNVAAIRLRQAQATEAQRLVDLELAQATAACESASDDADRIAKTGAVRKATHFDEVQLHREVVTRLPAVRSNIVTSGNDGGAVGAAPRSGAATDGGGSFAAAKEVYPSRVDPPLPPGVPASFAKYPASYHPDIAYLFRRPSASEGPLEPPRPVGSPRPPSPADSQRPPLDSVERSFAAMRVAPTAQHTCHGALRHHRLLHRTSHLPPYHREPLRHRPSSSSSAPR